MSHAHLLSTLDSLLKGIYVVMDENESDKVGTFKHFISFRPVVLQLVVCQQTSGDSYSGNLEV